MFATFHSSMANKSNSKNKSKTSGTNDEDRSTRTTTRSRRSQVSRACVWCRTNRIKCDEGKPCKNCADRGRECIKPAVARAASMANSREIDELKAQVSTLEARLQTKEDDYQPLSPRRSQSSSSASHLTQQSPAANDNNLCISTTTSTPPVWRHTDTSNSAPNSAMELVGVELAEFDAGHEEFSVGYDDTSGLTSQAEENEPGAPRIHPLSQIELPSLCSTANFARYTESCLSHAEKGQTLGESLMKPTLIFTPSNYNFEEQWTRVQENYHLDQFWQSFHFLAPIVDIRQFQEYHDSLWSSPCPSSSESCETERQPSALLDVVLALCMQYSKVTYANRSSGSEWSEEENLSGFSLFNRCQSAIAGQDEVDSMMVLRCRIYSIVFLLNVDQTYSAYQQLEAATKILRARSVYWSRIESFSQAQRNLLRLIWRSLIILDTKICIDLDRPFLMNDLTIAIEPSFENSQAAELPSAGWGPGPSSLIYHTQSYNLALLTRAIRVALQSHWIEMSTINAGDKILDSRAILEGSASMLLPHLKILQSWAENIPETLKLPRQGESKFSLTGKSLLELDVYTPLWLQRQRVHLELLYHNTMSRMYRLYTRFNKSKTTGTTDHSTPISYGHSTLALKHAATTTNIIHQLLDQTEIMNNWYDIYDFQWDAAISLLAASIASPACAVVTPVAREAISKSVSNFQRLSKYGVASASDASRLAQSFQNRIDSLEQKFLRKPRVPSHSRTPQRTNSSPSTANRSPADPSQNLGQLSFLQFTNMMNTFPPPAASLQNYNDARGSQISQPINFSQADFMTNPSHLNSGFDLLYGVDVMDDIDMGLMGPVSR